MAPPQLQPVTGLTPPQLAEARIREVWPSVAAVPALAGLGRLLTRTVVLAPLAWLLMSLYYFGKLMPLVMRRYTLTNRRLMIRKGWSGSVGAEVALKEIDEVRVVPGPDDANRRFFRAANLEILTGSNVALTLAGVPDPEAFREMILAARNAWVPERVHSLPFISASATK